MKMRITILYLALLAAFLPGCAKDADTPGDGRTALNVTSDIAFTRAAGDSWAADDAIGIFMLYTADGTTAESNRRYTTAAGDGVFAPGTTGETIYFPVDASKKVDFAAYYPYGAGHTATDIEIDIAEQSDQAALDYMTADPLTERSKQNPSVPLVFRHRMSKLVLNLAAGDGRTAAELAGISIALTEQYATGTLDITTGAIAPSGTAANLALLTTTNGLSAEATLIPSAAGSGAELVFTLADGVVLRWAVPAGKAFEAGQRTIYNIKVHAGEVELVGVTLEDWTDTDGGTHATWPAISTPADMTAFLAEFATAFGVGGTSAKQAEAVAKWTGNTGIVRLGADIDMTNVTVTAVLGNATHKVVFDGCGKTLDGLTARLFYNISAGSEVRNLVLEGVKIETDIIQIGAVASYNSGTIRNVSMSGTVSGSSAVGGITGDNVGMIIGCSVEGNSTVSGSSIVGGITGINSGIIASCSVGNGTTVSGTQGVGGIAGTNNPSRTIVGCWSAAASVTGSGGGIAGTNGTAASIDGCGWVMGTGALAKDVGTNNGGTVGVTFGVATADAMHTTNNAAKMNAAIAAIYDALPAAAKAGNVWWDIVDGKLTLVAANPGYGIGINSALDLRAFAADWNAAYVNGNRAATYAKQYAVLQDWADGDATWGGNATGDADAPRGTVRLLADIDLGDAAWTPIGTQERGITYAGFSGTFDGRRADAAAGAIGHECNYKITGLAVSNVREAGLFSKVAPGGTVSNVTVEGSVSGTGIAGGILNWNNGGTISGCFFKGDVSAAATNASVGGIAAENLGTVTGCGYLGGTVSGNGSFGNGGIVGNNYSGTITLCYSLADEVTAGTNYRGGIVGWNSGGTASSSFWLKADGNAGQPGVAVGYPSGNGTGCASHGTAVAVEAAWRTAMGQP